MAHPVPGLDPGLDPVVVLPSPLEDDRVDLARDPAPDDRSGRDRVSRADLDRDDVLDVPIIPVDLDDLAHDRGRASRRAPHRDRVERTTGGWAVLKQRPAEQQRRTSWADQPTVETATRPERPVHEEPQWGHEDPTALLRAAHDFTAFGSVGCDFDHVHVRTGEDGWPGIAAHSMITPRRTRR